MKNYCVTVVEEPTNMEEACVSSLNVEKSQENLY